MRHESQTPVSAARPEGKPRPLFSFCFTISAARLAGLATTEPCMPARTGLTQGRG